MKSKKTKVKSTKTKAKLKELRYIITIKSEPFENAMNCSHAIENMIAKTKGLSVDGAGVYLIKPRVRDLGFTSKTGYISTEFKKQVKEIRKKHNIKIKDFTMTLEV